MAAKRLLSMIVPVVLLAPMVWAQTNGVSLTGGVTFVSTQSFVDSKGYAHSIHFENTPSIAASYSHLLKTMKGLGLHAELPVAVYFRMNLNTQINVIPADIGALFATPSIRLNAFARDSVSPWVSAGAGYGRFREAPRLNFYGPNPGPTGTNTSVIQFGAGLDVWFWHNWGFRGEALDFNSGLPAYNVDTGKSRQNNYYVGAGVMHRF